MRTEALNKRLAEIGKVMSAVHSGFLAVDAEEDVVSGPRLQSREPVTFVETRPAPVLVMHEGVAIAWPKPEEIAAPEASVAVEAEMALEMPEAIEVAGMELAVAKVVENPLEEAEAGFEFAPQAHAPLEFAPLDLSAVEAEEPALSIAEIVEMPVAVEEAVAGPELETIAVAFEESAAEYAEVPAAALALELLPEVADEGAGEVGIAELGVAQDTELVEAEELTALLPGRAAALVAEARRLLEESSARLDVAVQREEQAAEQLHATQESLAAAYQSATEQLTAAERFWRLADEAATEAKRLFDASTAQLTVAVGKEQQSSADFQSAQQALTAAYQAAIQRLEAAEQFSKEGEGFAQETRKLLERMEAELGQARSDVRSSNEDLHSARQELTTAYQFASVAAQRRLDSAELFRKTADWVVFSTAFAWMMAVWMAWVAYRQAAPFAIPFAVSCAILAGAILMRKRGARVLEEA